MLFSPSLDCLHLKHRLKFIFINNPSCLLDFFFSFVIFKSVRKIINVSCNTLFFFFATMLIYKKFLHFSLVDECANEAFFSSRRRTSGWNFSFIVFLSFVHRIIGLKRSTSQSADKSNVKITARNSHRFLSRYPPKSFQLLQQAGAS